MQRRASRHVGLCVGALCAVLVVGCKNGVPSDAADATVPITPVKEAPYERPAPPSAPQGFAYLLASQPTPPPAPGDASAKFLGPFVRSVVAIDPSGAVARVEIPGARVGTVRRGSDGRAYVIASLPGKEARTARVFRLEGKTVAVVAELPDCRQVAIDSAFESPFDVRGDHVIVSCGKEGLFERRGASDWTKLAVPRAGLFAAAWIAKDGAVWFGTHDGVWERVGDTWSSKAAPKGAGEPINFFDGPGGVYVTLKNRGLFRVSGEQLEQVRPHTGGARVLWASSNGTTGALDEGPRLLRLDTLERGGQPVKAQRELSYRSAVDDGGRVWGVRDGRLVVTDAKTGETETVPMGGYAELDYIEPQPIVLLEGGPAVPPPRPVRRTKRLEITIAVDGKPAKNADVEVCPAPSTLFGTPCGRVDPSLVLRTKTDESGKAALDDVPMGTLYVHWKDPAVGKWRSDLWMAKLREGDVSTVEVTPSVGVEF